MRLKEILDRKGLTSEQADRFLDYFENTNPILYGITNIPHHMEAIFNEVVDRYLNRGIVRDNYDRAMRGVV